MQKDDYILLNTTPYIGLIKNNKDFPDEVAIEYFGTKITFRKLINNVEIVAKSLVSWI